MFLLPLVVMHAERAHAQSPDQVGQWGPVLDWGVQGKHMIVQHTGRVLVWATGDNARVWNPATGQFTLTPATFGDLHCGAQATLADGRTIAVGGVQVNPHDGIKVTGLFDPLTNTWTEGRPMNYARWYGTATTLPDGRVLASSGDDESGGRVLLPEIYDPIANTWTVLTNASRSMSLYPYMYVLPNGKVMEAGTRTSTGVLDLGAGTWSNGPTNPFGSNGYSECGAMYAPGRIVRSGGGDPAMARVSVIDMNAASPSWREIGPMAFPRRRHNVVLLPDGNVLAVGGTGKSDDEGSAVLAAELWNPATEQWSTMASMSEARMYHSAAVLLPDGRVVTAGGEASGRLHAQIYSPPYLFKGARPTITSAPATTSYGSSFNVGTPDAAGITAVRLLRPCAVTHAIDMNQRAMTLAFTAGAGSLTVTAPANPNVAPPGYYMLVITNANGVPSVAAWVRLDSSGNLTPGRVNGRVTNAANGAAIANATVSYSGGSTTTAANGSYEFGAVLPGEHSFSAAASGYATVTRSLSVTAGGNFVLDFALASPGAIQGRVTDAGTGAGISGATVSVEGTSTLTNASGFFTVTGLAAGAHQVSAAATGYYSADRQVTVSSGTTTTADFALSELDPRITGEVLDGSTAQPIAGANVAYSGGTTTTDALGRYGFTNVTPGTYDVTASASGYVSQTHQTVVSPRTWSSQDFALVSLSGGTFRFAPAADAQVKSDSPGNNYGTLATIRGRAPTPEYRSYLKFNVGALSGDVRSAKLRLFCSDDSPDGGAIYLVSNDYVGTTTPWVESGLNWSNAPLIGGTPVAPSKAAGLNVWVDYDVTAAITGTGTFSLALTSGSTNSVYYSSKEGAYPPELEVQTWGSTLPRITDFQPPNGPVGSEVAIEGHNFVGVTGVSFNGTPATFIHVQSPNLLHTLVPSGATTGKITVSTADGIGESATDFVVVVPPSIASFTPGSGVVGTVVTIQGNNFVGVSGVTFNGTAATSFTVESSVLIHATVPPGATTGKIGVTNRAATTFSANDFAVLNPPNVVSLTPAGGAVGSQVTIDGSNFAGVTAVTFNGTAATSYSVDSPSRIRALVPSGATTGRIAVRNADGIGQSATDFVVGPPAVTSFTPGSGMVGTTVTLQGSNFVGVNAVSFNGMVATVFTTDSPTQIHATVPTGATTGRIGVATAGGSAQSATNFVVTAPPPIVSLAPAHDAHVASGSPSGNYGTLASLRLRSSTSPFYNSYLKFEVSGVSPPVQKATLKLFCTDASPDGGAVYLVSSNYLGTTTPWLESGLTWSNAPAIGGTPIVPSKVAGLNVWVEYDVTAAITGNGTYSFGLRSNSSNSVYYNSKEASTNRPVLVVESLPGPVIASFTPASGPVGSMVTIAGSNFVGVTEVAFNGTAAASYSVDSPTAIRAMVPSGANSGKIAVSSAEGTGQSATDFTVVLPPGIASFAPASGPVGTVVTIDGSNFTGVTGVTFNGTAATSFTVESNVRIRATVPSGASTGRIGVTNAAASASSATDFAVLYPPVIASFTPASGLVGSEVTIAGSSFVGVTGVSFNGVAAATYTVDSPTAIRATVPSGASSGKIAVGNGDGTGQSATDFTVVLPPGIASFAPGNGPVGTVVTIDGGNFAGVNAVRFNGTAATVFTVESSVRIRATVPSGAGSGRIEVGNAAGSAQSATDFVVTVPPPIVSFGPVHDAHVSSGSASGNYGTLATLRVRSTTSPFYNSYLKFEVSGVSSVLKATLRLYCTDDSPDGGAIYLVSNNYQGTTTPWVESGLTWSNAPAIGGTPVTPSKAVGKDVWVEYDVTAAITGSATYSFAVRSNSSNSAYYASKEATINPPELVIEGGSGAPAGPAISSFTPGSGPVGTEVTIAGSGFVGVSGVIFNGTPTPTFTVDSPTRVRATVPAGATSGPIEVESGSGTAVSALAFTVTSGGSQTLSFPPSDDAQVYSSSPTASYGGLATLRARSADYRFYLKFTVAGASGAIASAKLRLFVTDPSSMGGSLYLVSNDYLGTGTPWSESGLTWNNAPALGASPAVSLGTVATGAWAEFDVTSLVTDNGTYSFGIASTTTNSVIYSSKESTTSPPNVPELVVQLATVPKAVVSQALESVRVQPVSPNPTRDGVAIQFELQHPSAVKLSVYDVTGRLVKQVFDGLLLSGPQRLRWDGNDAGGGRAGSGVYFYRLEMGAQVRTGKILVQR